MVGYFASNLKCQSLQLFEKQVRARGGKYFQGASNVWNALCFIQYDDLG